MRLRSKLLIGAVALAAASPVLADINYTQGVGTVIFAFTCFTTKVCPAHVNVNSAGAEIMTTAAPAQVQVGDGTNQAAVKAASTAAGATDKSLVTNESPNSLLTTTVNGATATTTHGCSIAGYGLLGCLGQIDDDLKGPTTAGTNIIGKVGIDQTTPGTTNGVQLPTTTNGGAATVKGGVAVVNGGSFYQAVAASQTATVLQSSTGAAGDYLSHCDIYPTSTSPGVVTVFDNTNTAATSAILFPGGASSVSNLVPFAIPVGAVSTAGAWKVTTGANVSVVCYGKFS